MNACDQLIQEASAAAGASLAWLLSPWLVDVTHQAIAEQAERAVDALTTWPDDSGIAAPIVVACTGTMDPPPEWWASPLGVLCARHFVTDERLITRRVAAAMLGIAPGTLSPILARGNSRLRRAESGELVAGSVFAEVAYRAEVVR